MNSFLYLRQPQAFYGGLANLVTCINLGISAHGLAYFIDSHWRWFWLVPMGLLISMLTINNYVLFKLREKRSGSKGTGSRPELPQ
jgi:hypothetical protein